MRAYIVKHDFNSSPSHPYLVDKIQTMEKNEDEQKIWTQREHKIWI